MPEFLRRQVHRRHTHAGGADEHRKEADGGDELQEAEAGSPDAVGQEDVEKDPDQPQKQICGGQKQRTAQNRAFLVQTTTPNQPYTKPTRKMQGFFR